MDEMNQQNPEEVPSGEERNERKPFVEPELRCETDLINGTGDRRWTMGT